MVALTTGAATTGAGGGTTTVGMVGSGVRAGSGAVDAAPGVDEATGDPPAEAGDDDATEA